MRSVPFLALALLAGSRPVDAGTCSYSTEYSSPGITGACTIDAVAGCPVHVLVPHEEAQFIMPTVQRDGAAVDTTTTVTTVGSFTQALGSWDYFSCDCHDVTINEQFDQIEIGIAAGTQEGDTVFVDGQAITIGPAGTCDPTAWPTMVEYNRGGCDLCPIDPVDPVGDDDDAGDGGGCSTGGAAGLGAALLGLLAIRRRR